MQIEVIYDTSDSQGRHDLSPQEVPLMGVEPVEIEEGCRARYEFPTGTSLSDIERALDQSDWCYLQFRELDEQDEALTPS